MVRLTLAAPKQAAEKEILDPSGVGTQLCQQLKSLYNCKRQKLYLPFKPVLKRNKTYSVTSPCSLLNLHLP